MRKVEETNNIMAKKNKETKAEDYEAVQEKARRLDALINVIENIKDKDTRTLYNFDDFLDLVAKEPTLVLRDIFQLFHDLVNFYISEGIDEYGKSEESIGFLKYDSSKLFVENCDDPFFADRLFANRFMQLIRGFRKGIPNNRIYLFEGPAGSGKSTFLNNLLLKLESYTKLPQGVMYETVWRLDVDKIGGINNLQKKLSTEKLSEEQLDIVLKSLIETPSINKKYYDIPCPNHDNPILQIPKIYRKDFLNAVIKDKKIKEQLFQSKEYYWVMKTNTCSICSSIFNALLDIVDDPQKIYKMVYARKVSYNRQFGKGISIFNPGDSPIKDPIQSPTIQKIINELLKTDEVKYIYSDLANTNNGVYALMDIKEQNIVRLKELHGIISDGVHKIGQIEEHIKSLFVGLINPEDRVNYENIKSFQDRVITVNIPYILDYNTEVSIYKNKFGREIIEKFLPRVLQNFAKIIISTRLDADSFALKKWIERPGKYSKYVDENLLLLKMEIYTGSIPTWLSEEDLRNFTKNVRKQIIEDSELEGNKGISGRQSLNIFNELITSYAKNDKLITMDILKTFFYQDMEEYTDQIPEGFIESLEDMYDYEVLQEIKESIYYYNEKQITRDILNYLSSINYDIGATEKSTYTGDTIEITEEYFKNFEAMFLGATSSVNEREAFRNDIQTEYISSTLSKEINIEKKIITQTTQFKSIFDKYTRNLKENALAPYIENENFRRAILDYGKTPFNTYDARLKRDVTYLITNLISKYKYMNEGAKQVCLYAIDKKLSARY